MEVKNNKLKKNFLELELGDIICIKENYYLSIVEKIRGADIGKNLGIEYCGIPINDTYLQFWFLSDTLDELREKVKSYPTDVERFSKDEYSLNLTLKKV